MYVIYRKLNREDFSSFNFAPLIRQLIRLLLTSSVLNILSNNILKLAFEMEY